MAKDDEIKITLEVCRDKTSGKLSIMAHFNSNAPNVFQDKDGYSWIPTVEEKDFISEAFELMPIDTSYSAHRKTIPKPEENKEEIKPTSETKPHEDYNKPTDLPSLEKPDESESFEETGEDNKTDKIVKEIDEKLKDAPNKPEEHTAKESKSDELEKKKEEEDEGIIVEADSDAIETALEKHTGKDKSIVEADEQTIVDKVLSQKKKGKWTRR